MTILQKKIKLKSQLFHKFFFLYYFLLPTLNTTTYSLSVSVSVSADMKNCISVFYRYRSIRKLYLSAHIGIGQYEKKLIVCSLPAPSVGGHQKKTTSIIYVLVQNTIAVIH